MRAEKPDSIAISNGFIHITNKKGDGGYLIPYSLGGIKFVRKYYKQLRQAVNKGKT